MGRGRVRVHERIGYKPRAHQESLHKSLKRFGVLVAHRRFGKTVFAIGHLIWMACRNKRKAPRYAYVAPYYRQAKVVAWDYLKRFTLPVPDVAHHETELRCDFFGDRRITLYGADHPDRLRGLYLDGVVLDEYAQMNPRMWSEVIRPALADRKGWAIFIGTPMGRNAFWQLYEHARQDEAWSAALFRAGETGVVDSAELAAARAVMSEEEYAQEFGCSFDAAIRGAYYGKLVAAAESEKRIGAVPWEPGLPVHTAWDLGIGDSTAIWFCQQVGQETRLIDFHEASGVGLAHYARALQARPYAYGEHILPHDARVHEMGTGKTRLETLAALGIRGRVLPPLPVDDGIEAARNLLPRCWFDAAKCTPGLEALRQYRCEWDDERKTLRDRPLHDWCSNAADAFRYLAVGLRRETAAARPIKYDNAGIV